MFERAILKRAEKAGGEAPLRVLVWGAFGTACGVLEQDDTLAEGVCWATYPAEKGRAKSRVFCWHPELSEAQMDLFERLGGDLPDGSDVLGVVRALGGGVK